MQLIGESCPVFAIGVFSVDAVAAFARSFSAKVILEVSAGGIVHLGHLRDGLYILGKYHHLELTPTWVLACFINIIGAFLRCAASRSGVADVT